MAVMDKKYNVAVIGYGWAATAHIARHQRHAPGAGHRRLVVARRWMPAS